jgi:hypothetical protein
MFEKDQMELAPSTRQQQSAAVAQDLSFDDLSMPSLGGRTTPSSLQELSTTQAPQLRDIASSASAEELAFYKFQVERQQASFDPTSIETYAQGTLPSPQALLKAAA